MREPRLNLETHLAVLFTNPIGFQWFGKSKFLVWKRMHHISGRETGLTTVGGVLADLARRPLHYLVRGWHWKASLFSSIIRSAIFFSTNLSAGLDAAYGAAGAEFLYRIVAAGCYGSLTQAFRQARPVWLANLTALLILPTLQHLIEFGIHWWRGTPNFRASIFASVLFTIYATLFNLYAMRRGTMVVGKDARSIWNDLRHFPALFLGFITAGPKGIWRLAHSATRRWRVQ